MLIKTSLLHQSSGPHVFLSFSLSLFFRLIPWSTEALWVHFPARASKTLLRRCSVPSPHRDGAWGLREQSKPHAGALLAFCVNQGISASFSPLLSYHQLWTTKFPSIKGPQHGSNCCFLICIHISQEAGKMVWYSHLLKNFPQFLMIHSVKGFGIVNEADFFSGILLLFLWSNGCWQFDFCFLCLF